MKNMKRIVHRECAPVRGAFGARLVALACVVSIGLVLTGRGVRAEDLGEGGIQIFSAVGTGNLTEASGEAASDTVPGAEGGERAPCIAALLGEGGELMEQAPLARGAGDTEEPAVVASLDAGEPIAEMEASPARLESDESSVSGEEPDRSAEEASTAADEALPAEGSGEEASTQDTASAVPRTPEPTELRAINPKGTTWPNGSRLRVRFLDGTPEKHRRVTQAASQWARHANLTFQFDSKDADAEIRITFKTTRNCSYIGTQARGFSSSTPTMQLYNLDQGTVIHEFGHALGLGHEHSNPAGGIQWDEPKVYAYYQKFCGWGRDITYSNVIYKYSENQVNGTAFDPQSVMLYAFPASLTRNNIGTRENGSLSRTDIAFIKKLYPGRPGGNEPGPITPVTPDPVQPKPTPKPNPTPKPEQPGGMAQRLGPGLQFKATPVFDKTGSRTWWLSCDSADQLKNIKEVRYLTNPVAGNDGTVVTDRRNGFSIALPQRFDGPVSISIVFLDSSVYRTRKTLRE